MELDHICVYFGKGSDGEEWSITARGFSTPRQAEKHGLFMMPVPGCFGFAVITQGESESGPCFWQVREDLSILPNDRSITMGDYNNFKITTLVGKLQYV